MQSTISGIQQNWLRMQSTIDGVSDKLEKFNTQSTQGASGALGNLQNTELQNDGTEGASRAWRIDEIQFINNETQIVVNAKLFLDINKSIEDIKINLKHLEQETKTKLLEKKKEIISEAVKQANELKVILRNHF